MNPYEVLGVSNDATDEEIKKAYRKLVKKWHPDLVSEEKKAEGNKKMQKINEAYDVLTNPERRAEYDAQNMGNIYEYYSKKNNPSSTKSSKSKKGRSSKAVENEKKRKAVLQFLDVEYQNKAEIFEMLDELADGAVNGIFSKEEYEEMLELILESANDCISRIEKIISIVLDRKMPNLDSAIDGAKDTISEISERIGDVPKTLEEAKEVEENRRIIERINILMKGIGGRAEKLSLYNLLYRVWEFENDKQLDSARKKQKKSVEQLINDIEWIHKNAAERDIDVSVVTYRHRGSRYESETTLEDCLKEVKKSNAQMDLNLQELREASWKEYCTTNENGEVCFNPGYLLKNVKGKLFICSPNVDCISSNALEHLNMIDTIYIPAKCIPKDDAIRLNENTKKLVIMYNNVNQVVDISDFTGDSYDKAIMKQKDFIVAYSKSSFRFITKKKVYSYDSKTICYLTGSNSIEELRENNDSWESYYFSLKKFENQVKIHTWVQNFGMLPDPIVIINLPCKLDSMKQWMDYDTTNFENAISGQDHYEKIKIWRLYEQLGALKSPESHNKAEFLISKVDFEKVYRSRLARCHGDYYKSTVSIPEYLVQFIIDNSDNKEFMRYIMSFVEGYKLYESEAKKAGVKLTPEFIIRTAPQQIFQVKADLIGDFAKELLDVENKYDWRHVDRLLILRRFAETHPEGSIYKNIIETKDDKDKYDMYYEYVDLKSLQTYLEFHKLFKVRKKRSQENYFCVESDNVFVSPNSHAIKIFDSEGRSALVILNLLEEGELFADIVSENLGIGWADFEGKRIKVVNVIKRALIAQMDCNEKVKGISIGCNEDPWKNSSYWRNDLRDGNKNLIHEDCDWIDNIKWIKFEIYFTNRDFGMTYKGYRARFMIAGHQQKLNRPRPYDNPKWQIAYDRAMRRRHRIW